MRNLKNTVWKTPFGTLRKLSRQKRCEKRKLQISPCWRAELSNSPGLLQESLGPFGPEVSQECPCPRKRGCPRGCLRRTQKCPKSVPRVFSEYQKDVRTLRGHSWLDTPEPGGDPVEGLRRHPVGHSFEHCFRGTRSGTLSGHFGPEGPKRLL